MTLAFFFSVHVKMSKRFGGERFLDQSEAIRKPSKELSDEENYISDDESQNEDCFDIKNREFIDIDKHENDE
ncbi:hypothetical protein NPIL_160451 [Nephila pilipes]|uniref:Uncharacterized protein n=1 Tax=Nephila pilipes TaxID=299642 RepID=A0A8X6MV94_NEPPI|nr:hypothetical protein NPIL_160451 [Nephila pilipes]